MSGDLRLAHASAMGARAAAAVGQESAALAMLAESFSIVIEHLMERERRQRSEPENAGGVQIQFREAPK